MALTVTDSISDIQSKGGGIVKAVERLSTGAALSSPDTPHTFGKFKDSKFKDKTPYEPRYDESGAKVANEEGNRDTGFELTFMARDADHINNLRNEVRGKYYLSMKVLSKVAALGGYTQIQFAFGQFHPDVEFSLPGGEIPGVFEGLILNTALSLTPGELTLWAGNTTALPATITIPAGDWTTVFEVSTWV